mmetsp:Transcript_18634/g.38848  ORF Transcript_18634/g.38848 Transcript_18634/m.38848 type:complete len:219 (-) Transcript_18634:1461-2117(-)
MALQHVSPSSIHPSIHHGQQFPTHQRQRQSHRQQHQHRQRLHARRHPVEPPPRSLRGECHRASPSTKFLRRRRPRWTNGRIRPRFGRPWPRRRRQSESKRAAPSPSRRRRRRKGEFAVRRVPLDAARPTSRRPPRRPSRPQLQRRIVVCLERCGRAVPAAQVFSRRRRPFQCGDGDDVASGSVAHSKVVSVRETPVQGAFPMEEAMGHSVPTARPRRR